MASDYGMLRKGITSLGDYQQLQNEFDLKKAEQALQKQALLQRAQGQDPAALKLANEYEAAIQSGNTDRANRLAAFAKIYDKNVMQTPEGTYVPLPGLPSALGQIELGKESGTQTARDIHEPGRAGNVENERLIRQLQYNPLIAEKEKTAILDAERKAARQGEADIGEKTLPIIEELKTFNEQSPSIPYAGKTQFIRRLVPGTSPEEASVDLMRQARIDLAAPLAKQLGVNPTDKDFQASLDRIFDIEASKESRKQQIQALEDRIKSRQKQLLGGDPLAASRAAIQQRNAQGIQNPNQTLPGRSRLRYNPQTGELE